VQPLSPKLLVAGDRAVRTTLREIRKHDHQRSRTSYCLYKDYRLVAFTEKDVVDGILLAIRFLNHLKNCKLASGKLSCHGWATLFRTDHNQLDGCGFVRNVHCDGIAIEGLALPLDYRADDQ